MSLLFRYLFKNNCRLLLLTLALGVGLYLLVEVVDKADVFVETGSGFSVAAMYFLVRTPFIISQILPAVFLLATVIQLCFLAKSRELVALQAGGLAYSRVVTAVLLCGVFWGGVQLAFSQYVGIKGDAYAERIWKEEIRKREAVGRTAENIWFTEGDYIVSFKYMELDDNQSAEGRDLSIYHLAPDGLRFTSIYRAPVFTARAGDWASPLVTHINPDTFTRVQETDVHFPIKQNPAFFFVSSQSNPQQFSLWVLGEAIQMLQNSGSNVEGLLTAWHSKVAYAASLVVLALLAAAMLTLTENVYVASAVAMVTTFILYVCILVGESLGSRGSVPPAVAAWAPNIILAVLALWRLHVYNLRR